MLKFWFERTKVKSSLKCFFTCASFISIMSGLATAAPFKVGLVLDKGGKDDKSFNSSANIGAIKAKNDLKVHLKVIEAGDDNSFEPHLRNFARSNYDLIISIGFAQAEAIKKISGQFKNSKFAIVDAEVVGQNVRSLLFQEHEGSFLAGALAASTSKTGKLGFIGGMDIPLIRRFLLGFEAGAHFVNPKSSVAVNFVGISGDSWNNPPKAKELAVTQYSTGIDVIYGAAGASTVGLLDAAEEKGKLAIGVDSNQNGIKPGNILTSMVKRVDVAVFNVIKEASEGKFQSGSIHYGLANHGVDLAMDKYNEKLISTESQKKLALIRSEIISGKIKVPDYYQNNDSK